MMVELFEETTGLSFDASGPNVCECEHCGGLFQYIPDHSCFGSDGEAHTARYGGHGVIEE